MKETKPEFSRGSANLDNEGAYFLYQAAGWARFLAIVGFVMYGLVMLIFLIGTITSSDMYIPEYGMQNPMPYAPSMIFSWTFFILMVIIMGVMCIPLVYLYNFSTKVRKAFNEGNSQILSQSMRALKNMFVFYGIFIIIYFSLLLLSTMMFTMLG